MGIANDSISQFIVTEDDNHPRDKIFVIPIHENKPIKMIFEDRKRTIIEEPDGSISIISPLPKNMEIILDDIIE